MFFYIFIYIYIYIQETEGLKLIFTVGTNCCHLLLSVAPAGMNLHYGGAAMYRSATQPVAFGLEEFPRMYIYIYTYVYLHIYIYKHMPASS